MSAGRTAGALAALACAACAGAPARPAADLTPFSWSWTQIALGGVLIRYGIPVEKEAAGDAGGSDEPPAFPAEASVRETRFAAYRYGCAREDGESVAACTVLLDFSLLELDPPLADLSPGAWRARIAGPPAGPGELARDSHGRPWCHRTLALAGGGVFSQYSFPIDAQRALAVSSTTTRAPDRVAARDLAREAIDRLVVASEPH